MANKITGVVNEMRCHIVDAETVKRNPRHDLAESRFGGDGFTKGQMYRVEVLQSGLLVVKDDNGETVICDREDFRF